MKKARLVLIILIVICINCILCYAAIGASSNKITPKTKTQASVESLIAGLKDPKSYIRMDAAIRLREIKDKRAVEPLCEALEDEVVDVRYQVVYALGALGEIDDHAIKCLITALEDKNVGSAAAISLVKIGGPAVQALTEALKNPDIKERVVQLLAGIGKGNVSVKVKGDILESLCSALKDKSARVQDKAALALGNIGDARAVGPLSLVLNDPNVQIRATEALGKIGKPAVEVLIVALSNSKSNVRMNAARALGEIKDERAIEPLRSLLDDEDLFVRGQASAALGKIGKSAPEKLTGTLTEDLKSQDPAKRAEAARILGDIKDKRAVETLIAALKDHNWEVRQKAAGALGQIQDARAVEALIAALRDDVDEVRRSASFGLAEIGEPGLEPLIVALKDQNRYVRSNAARALGIMKDYRGVEPLIAALKDSDNRVQHDAEYSLSNITGKHFGNRPEEWQEWWDQVRERYLKKVKR